MTHEVFTESRKICCANEVSIKSKFDHHEKLRSILVKRLGQNMANGNMAQSNDY